MMSGQVTFSENEKQNGKHLNELNLVIPDGFHRMSDEELKKLNRVGGSGTDFCISDPERHIMF